MAEHTQHAEPDRGQEGAEETELRESSSKITSEEMNRFLGGGRICRLGCLMDDGAPYVVPCWYEWTGKEFYIIPRKKSVWARYLQRDGRVCLNISNDTPPYRQV